MRFALLAGDRALDFVVIGGLNPDFLAPDAPVPHQGTTDVDLLFALGVSPSETDQDFAWLDTALDAGGFESVNGWRWDATVGQSRVRLELLCDVWDHTADTVPLPGSTRAVACKIAGPAAALADPVSRELRVTAAVRADFPMAPETITLRFANLGGYLLAKAAAAISRGLAKDRYDLMYVMLFNDHGGAAGAAAAVTSQLMLTEEIASPDDIVECLRRFLDASGTWAGTFAEVMMASGDDSAEAQLRADAASGARRCLDMITTQ